MAHLDTARANGCTDRRVRREGGGHSSVAEIAATCRAAAELSGHALEIEYLSGGFEYRVRECGSSRATEPYRCEALAWVDCCLTFQVMVPNVHYEALETALLQLLELEDGRTPWH